MHLQMVFNPIVYYSPACQRASKNVPHKKVVPHIWVNNGENCKRGPCKDSIMSTQCDKNFSKWSHYNNSYRKGIQEIVHAPSKSIAFWKITRCNLISMSHTLNLVQNNRHPWSSYQLQNPLLFYVQVALAERGIS